MKGPVFRPGNGPFYLNEKNPNKTGWFFRINGYNTGFVIYFIW